MTIQQKWDNRYQQKQVKPAVAEVLQHNHYLLPEKGVALDLACGVGGNALFLAAKGLTVQAMDISPNAIATLQQYAREQSLTIATEVRDVIAKPPAPMSVDVLIVSHFLSRELCLDLARAVRPGGLLLYQTYCANKVRATGPNNPDYLLEDNELLRLFPRMRLRVYREESTLGQHHLGMRNQAWAVLEQAK